MTPTEALKVLYRYASRGAHPDHGGSDEAFVKVTKAAEVLKLNAPAPPRHEPWQLSAAMPFGKHKGKRLGSLPGTYLSWMSMNMHDESLRECAGAVLAWRAKR